MFRKLTLFFLFPLLAAGQQPVIYDVSAIAPHLKSRASAVVRDMTTVVDLRPAEHLVLTVKETTTILNKNGEQKAALFLNYDKSIAIKNVKGLIFDGLGNQTGKFSLSDFKDESVGDNFSLFNDDRIKYYIPSVVAYPYTISYEYEIRYKQNLVVPDWYANRHRDVAVEKSSYTVLSKPGDKLHIKAFNYKGTTEILESDKLRSETWMVSNLPAFRYEPYSPDEDSYLTHVKIAPEKFSYYGHSGSYRNWKDLGKWVYDDLVQSRQLLTTAAEEEIKNLVRDVLDEKEKVKMIYEYVQKKTRYVSVQIGIGGFQPFTAMDVHRLSYGDCKALVNYTQSLLKVVGIRSDYCVVNAGSFKMSPDPDFASMNQFNHIILCVPLKNDTTWLECTSQESPFGYLGTFTDDRIVWACTPEGGKLIRTPALNTADNLMQRKVILKLDAEGNLRGKMEIKASGSRYGEYGQLIGEPYAEQLKKLKKQYDVDNIDFSKARFEQIKNVRPLAVEDLEFEIFRYVPSTGNRAYLVPNIFNKMAAVQELRSRTLPVYINRGFTDEDEITFELPENETIELKPENKLIDSDFGSYRISIGLTGRQLVYRRKLVLNSGTFPAARYADFASFIDQISSADNGKIVLKFN